MTPPIPVVNAEQCIACGNCEQVCPEVSGLTRPWGIRRSSIPPAHLLTAFNWPLINARPRL